jgi:hypothetical protein
MSKIKKETTVSHQQQRKYPSGTMLAVDLYANGNFFEAELKNYRTDKRDKDINWAFVQYVDDKETKGWIDLNIIRVVELSEENILTQEDFVGKNLTDDEKGFVGRRLTVLWLDDARYTGTITKTMKDDKSFVFITYDNGDKCWYNLSPECEEPSRFEETESVSKRKNSSKNSTKSSTKVKEESTNAQEESSTSKKSVIDADFKKYELARKELEKKYPIGCTIFVDIYHDEHYHEAIVKKYLANTNKRQQAKGEQWIYIQFLDKVKTKQWIDLSCIKAINMSHEKTLRLDELKPGDDKGFLGKRIVVEWQDGNKYRGLATRSAKDNKHFVFLEYDDGDECWCDLQRESEWIFDDEDSDDNDDDNSSGESVEIEKSRAKPKRKGNTEAPGQSTKKAKPFDF